MMRITAYKYQATGNDFVILDNREGQLELTESQIKHLCDRRFGVGADGLMLLNRSKKILIFNGLLQRRRKRGDYVRKRRTLISGFCST